MAEAKGIKETKEVMEFIFSFVDAIGKAKADDKFSWTDARYFIDPVKKLFEAVDNIEEVIPEITDIDDEEYDDDDDVDDDDDYDCLDKPCQPKFLYATA